MSWHERAACRGMDRELFFAPIGSSEERLALAVCAACPVRDNCLELAMRSESGTYREGIFGGTTAAERRRRAQDKKAAAAELADVDEAAIIRRGDGDTVPLTRAERTELIRRLRARGLADNEIARRARLKVERYAPPRRQLQKGTAA